MGSRTVYFTGMMVFTLISQMYHRISILGSILVRVLEYLSTSTRTGMSDIALEITSANKVRVPRTSTPTLLCWRWYHSKWPARFRKIWPLARYVKLWVAHAPGMPGTFSSPPRVSGPDMHHGTCVTHEPWCVQWSLTGSFLWSQWWGKHYRHSDLPAHAQPAILRIW